MPPLIDLRGQRFDRLIVMKRVSRERSKPHWQCRCVCGRLCVVAAYALRSGHQRSCGCLQAEITVRRSLRHGAAKRGHMTAEYRAWMNMRMRCTDASRPDYRYYGGRGIRVCEAWLDEFAAFLRDMGPKPFPKATIDRIDVNGPYAPSNCRWANWHDQRLNQRPRQKR